MATRVAYVDGRTDGRATVRRQARAASADRLRAGIDGSGGGGKAKIAMSRQGVAYEDGRTGGRVQAIPS